MKKIAICYFTYAEDINFINLSLKHLYSLIKSQNDYEVKIYVFDDARYKKQIKKKELSVPCTLISTKFNRNGNLNGFECVNGMFNEYVKIREKFDYDYLIKMDSDCVLNTFDYITMSEIRLSKQNMLNNLAQMGSYFAKLCCYGCCQTFTKLGIDSIYNLCLHMSHGSSKEAVIMKKRVELGWNEDKVVSLLMEMCPVLRIDINSFEGTKGHLNAFDIQSEDFSSYTSVAFKPNLFGSISWSKEESYEKMKQYVENYSFENKNDEFKSFVSKKKIAVVGNANVDKDYSEEIDSADLVIRLNNFYNYQSGKLGKRVDALVVSGLCGMMLKAPGDKPTQDNIIQALNPVVFVVSESNKQNILDLLHPRYKNCKKYMLNNNASDLKYTTGSIIIKMISEMNNVDVKYYGFDTDNNWQNYLDTYAIHHKNVLKNNEEETLRNKFLKS